MKIFKTNKVLDKLDKMLDNAISGKDIENNFDESKVSKIESKLHKYLLISKTHKKDLEIEKKRVDELVSDISHQTKTPLANLSLYTELLEESEDENEQKKYIALIKKQNEKLNFLISNLVKTSRLENGIISLKPKKQNINLLMEKINEIYPMIEINKNKIEVFYDLKWTYEAFENIIENAIKYGGTKIKIEISKFDFFCKIDIIDNGMGINEEEIPKIFQRFYRSEKVADKEGVGLGLFLAREIISKENGYIKVSTKIGVGSKFSIYLPLN